MEKLGKRGLVTAVLLVGAWCACQSTRHSVDRGLGSVCPESPLAVSA